MSAGLTSKSPESPELLVPKKKLRTEKRKNSTKNDRRIMD